MEQLLTHNWACHPSTLDLQPPELFQPQVWDVSERPEPRRPSSSPLASRLLRVAVAAPSHQLLHGRFGVCLST